MNFKNFAEQALQIYGPGNYEWQVEQRYDRDAIVVCARDRSTGRFATYEISGLDQANASTDRAMVALLQHVVDTIEELLRRDYDEMGNDQGSSRNQGTTTLRQAAKGLHSGQNNPVRETGRTLMEMLNE